jgi:penicillin-binding protein 2
MLVTEQGRRLKILFFIVAGVMICLLLRLAWMQILQGAQYKRVADQNRTRQVIEQAPRGIMYDRNGAVLVTNRPSFAVSLILSEYTNAAEETPLLASILGIDTQTIEKALRDSEDYPYTPIRLKRDVDDVVLAKIEERKPYLPGVIVEAMPIRHYIYQNLAAHVFGFVGTISEEEYAEKKSLGYLPSDLTGKDGLEREWESDLRGINGGLQVETNAQGEETGFIGEKAAIPGKSLMLTIDANLQKAAEEALAEQIEAGKKIGEPSVGGAVVVLDVKNGAVRVMVSNPAFDPNSFAGGISSKDWNAIINNSHHPLTNRAIQSTYPPGSVFKIVTAAAALDQGVTTPTEIFEDKGVYVLSGWSFYGWKTEGLGKLTIKGALEWSSDPVFYELGNRMGIDTLASYALTFGFGQLTGIKLFGEEKGTVPTVSWKEQNFGQSWYPGETLIAAIGQGYYLITPLQQAMLLMAVANGGIMYRPRLVDKVVDTDGKLVAEYQPEVMRTVYLRPEIWDTIRSGLKAVTQEGTAASIFRDFPQSLAGKTGSAETGRSTVHSWFACYAPADNPEIAVMAFVEEGGEGSVTAAPIVRKVLETYFSLPSRQLVSTAALKGKTD